MPLTPGGLTPPPPPLSPLCPLPLRTVLQGTDLKSKAAARRFACLAPHVVTDHFVVIDLLQQPVVPGSPHGSTHTAARPAPLRTDLARCYPLPLLPPLPQLPTAVSSSGRGVYPGGVLFRWLVFPA